MTDGVALTDSQEQMDRHVQSLREYMHQPYRTIFYPPLSTQRYCWVQDFLQQHQDIKSLTDVGCGNGRMLLWVKTVSNLEKINVLDVDQYILEDSEFFRPNLHEMLFGRKNSAERLNINVYQGDIAIPDERLQADCFTMVEMIEHITLEHLERVCRTVFGYYQPKMVVVTTPNYEFNHLLQLDGQRSEKFRHSDHKFEWTRQELMGWAQQVCKTHPTYTVHFDGVGSMPGSDPFGPCTQIAVFKRTEEPLSRVDKDVDCFDLLLNKLSVKGLFGDNSLRRVCLKAHFDIPGCQSIESNSGSDNDLYTSSWS